MSSGESQFDYIIVGSGAGGGPLAARLALAGCRVLVIEAGSDHTSEAATAPPREVSQVPSFHGRSTEHESLSWQFFVDHYADPPEPDPKRVQERKHRGFGKIFYPRASAVGGCTVHNAMITIAGPDSDWDDLADYVGDDSWRAETMRPYFQRLERNEYLPAPSPTPRSRQGRTWDAIRWLFGFTPDHTAGRHGFGGWLRTSMTDISLGLRDKQLIKMLKAALWESKRAGLDRWWTLVRRFLKGQVRQALDPNHARTQAESPAGLVLIPLAVCGEKTTIHKNSATPWVQRGRRSSPREFLLEARAAAPERLTIWTDCLVTEVTFDESGDMPRATGVKYLKGEKLYRAHPQPNPEKGTPGEIEARREVILCGGAFNTPQLLMLSGIGDEAHLKKHNIKCRVHLPGVGQNLQDRYEVTVISEMKKVFSLLDHATFGLPDSPTRPDPHLAEWREEGTGLYTSNGAVLGIFKRSRPDLPQPDLFIFGIPAPFRGYELGYSNVGDQHNLFTWAILKAHTRNTDGEIKLRKKDPLEPPEINFHYFNEESKPGKSESDPDLLAIVDGVKFVRGITRRASFVVRTEDHPGFRDVPEGSDEQIKNWIRREAWGHHACGTCRMGPANDCHAVLDSRFRVRDIEGLRVVDASIFPRIPGYFIVTNIYMASEKAADVILADYHDA